MRTYQRRIVLRPRPGLDELGADDGLQVSHLSEPRTVRLAPRGRCDRLSGRGR
jgi:hypothetical protein